LSNGSTSSPPATDPAAADRRLLAGLIAAAVPTALTTAVILGFVVVAAWPALTGDPGLHRFVVDDPWLPSAGRYGLAPLVIGSLAVSVAALLWALPCALALVAWLRTWCPRPLRATGRRVLELLAGMPSVVYGLWGLTAIVPLIGRLAPDGVGQSLLAGALVLGLMILPTIALAADAALAGVGEGRWRAAAACGLSRWTALRRIAWPHARGAIATGTVLAFARALGETMVVLMVCGNVVAYPTGPLDQLRTLTANIALEMADARAGHLAALFVGALALTLLVAAVVVAARLLAPRRSDGGA